MSRLARHKTELIRLALVALALLLSWLKIWRFFAGFDIIALLTAVIGGYPMFHAAWEDIRQRRMTMELSMAIAVTATLLIGHFFTGLVIAFFVLFAELLEHLTVESGRNVIGKLLESLPRQAVVRRNGREEVVDIPELQPNETVIIKPGTKIPVDGVVLKGHSSVEESSITGESLPAEKTAGHRVFAGTINQTGVLEVRVDRVGEDTTFGKIIHIIEEAEKAKAPIQKVADKLAGRLVYFAFAGAGMTFLFTHNIVSAIAALVVAGACGVAAGTPLAILAGIGRTAQEGVITKGGVYLEQLAGVDTVVLDKTGTLTLGTPEVTRVHAFGNTSEREILRMAASAEQHSEHPLAAAILKKAKGTDLSLEAYDNFQYFPGEGMACRINGNEILVGNNTLLEKKSIPLDPATRRCLAQIRDNGETGVVVVRNRQIIGILGVADVLRDEAREAVAALKKIVTRVILLTGDSVNIAEAIGKALKVDEVLGGMLPHQKLEKIQELIRNGKKVAMVGDGINDAPALVEAHVGIAMGTGTDVALESADIALMTANLMKIVETIRISRQVMGVIAFNFRGTILVDTAGVALAFLGYLTPLLGALIHVGSELAFILNSARLFRKHP